MKNEPLRRSQPAGGGHDLSCKNTLQRIGFFVGALALLACPRVSARQASRHDLNEGKTNACTEGLARLMATPGTESLALGIVLFHLDDAAVTEPRVAILDYHLEAGQTRLRILECAAGEIRTVFTLERPPWEGWSHLETFPSNGIVPGIVMWGGTDEGRTLLIVVCYTGGYSYLPSGKRVEKKGTFKVAFEGEEARVVDLDLDGIPEIVANMDKPSPEVWTYVDGTYVKVGSFPRDRLHSADVLNAIRAARAGREAAPPYR